MSTKLQPRVQALLNRLAEGWWIAIDERAWHNRNDLAMYAKDDTQVRNCKYIKYEDYSKVIQHPDVVMRACLDRSTTSIIGHKNHETDWYCVPFVPWSLRKSLPKKEVMKLQPMTWLQVKWMDGPDTLVLLLEKPRYQAGDVELTTIDPDVGEVNSRVDNTQVMAVHSYVVVPALPKPALIKAN